MILFLLNDNKKVSINDRYKHIFLIFKSNLNVDACMID